jgi:hypothetical protein
VRFEVLIAIKTECAFSWVAVALCTVVGGYQHFGALCCLHLQPFNPEVEAAWSSETPISNHHTAWHNNPENHEFYHKCVMSVPDLIDGPLVHMINAPNLKSHCTAVTSNTIFCCHLQQGLIYSYQYNFKK